MVYFPGSKKNSASVQSHYLRCRNQYSSLISSHVHSAVFLSEELLSLMLISPRIGYGLNIGVVANMPLKFETVRGNSEVLYLASNVSEEDIIMYFERKIVALVFIVVSICGDKYAVWFLYFVKWEISKTLKAANEVRHIEKRQIMELESDGSFLKKVVRC